jgi:hypothetical protein
LTTNENKKYMQNIKNELVDNDNKLNFKDVSFNPPGKENIDHKYCLKLIHTWFYNTAKY